MLKMSALLAGSENRRFVLTRASSTGLALFLALLYTKVLGIDKRSVLAFVMTASLIATIALTSGISLTYRKNISKGENAKNLDAYLALILFLSGFVAVISTGMLAIYSHIQTSIPLTLYMICFLYSFLASINFGYQDALLANAHLKAATTLDLATIIIQSVACLLLFAINITSLIVSVFLAFIFSYLLITSLTLFNLRSVLNIEWPTLCTRIWKMARESRHNYLYGIANGLADRVDRLIIGLILPIGYLAKYSLMSSLIMYTRFLPDALSKLSLMSEHARNKLSEQLKGWRMLLSVGIIACGIAGLAELFIYLVFGRVWLLPLAVPFFFALQEVCRGYYQIGTARLIAHGAEKSVARTSLALIGLSLIAISGATYLFGVSGAPLSMIFIYSFLIFRIKNIAGASASGQ